jgi:16S rRNA (guanine527-N7)-methyltransferase
VKHHLGVINRTADWLGVEFDSSQIDVLVAYADWLVTEGAAIGGIGPGEVDRVWDRHIADSLVFGLGIRAEATILDVGSGVGLPGIPLAIGNPDAVVSVLDRSGRRTDALRRVARMLELQVDVLTADVRRHVGRYDRVVMRAVLRPDRAGELRRLVVPGGDIVVGIGRGDRPSEPPGEGSLVQVDPKVLESGAWLLMIPVA